MNNNMLDEKERESFSEMLCDDIEFITGKKKYTYMCCFGINEPDSGLNILTNMDPGQLEGFIEGLLNIIKATDLSNVDTTKSGSIEYTVTLKEEK